MEYRSLLAFLSFFVVFLTSTTVFARRGIASTGNLDNGSGYNVDDLDELWSGDDSDDGSAGYGQRQSSRPVHPPFHGQATGSPNKDVGREQVSHFRSTTSVYNNGVDIGTADESYDEVKAEVMHVKNPAVLAVIIVGGVLVIVCIVLLIMFLVYRMRKKDEGSYMLDDPKTMMMASDHHQQQQTSSVVYIKAPTNDREFYA